MKYLCLLLLLQFTLMDDNSNIYNTKQEKFYEKFESAEVADTLFMDQLCDYLDCLDNELNLNNSPIRIIFSTIEDKFKATGFDRDNMTWTGYNPTCSDKHTGIYVHLAFNRAWRHGYMVKYRNYTFFFLRDNYMDIIKPSNQTEIYGATTFPDKKSQQLLIFKDHKFATVNDDDIMKRISE